MTSIGGNRAIRNCSQARGRRLDPGSWPRPAWWLRSPASCGSRSCSGCAGPRSCWSGSCWPTRVCGSSRPGRCSASTGSAPAPTAWRTWPGARSWRPGDRHSRPRRSASSTSSRSGACWWRPSADSIPIASSCCIPSCRCWSRPPSRSRSTSGSSPRSRARDGLPGSARPPRSPARCSLPCRSTITRPTACPGCSCSCSSPTTRWPSSSSRCSCGASRACVDGAAGSRPACFSTCSRGLSCCTWPTSRSGWRSTPPGRCSRAALTLVAR